MDDDLKLSKHLFNCAMLHLEFSSAASSQGSKIATWVSLLYRFHSVGLGLVATRILGKVALQLPQQKLRRDGPAFAEHEKGVVGEDGLGPQPREVVVAEKPAQVVDGHLAVVLGALNVERRPGAGRRGRVRGSGLAGRPQDAAAVGHVPVDLGPGRAGAQVAAGGGGVETGEAEQGVDGAGAQQVEDEAVHVWRPDEARQQAGAGEVGAAGEHGDVLAAEGRDAAGAAEEREDVVAGEDVAYGGRGAAGGPRGVVGRGTALSRGGLLARGRWRRRRVWRGGVGGSVAGHKAGLACLGVRDGLEVLEEVARQACLGRRAEPPGRRQGLCCGVRYSRQPSPVRGQSPEWGSAQNGAEQEGSSSSTYRTG